MTREIKFRAWDGNEILPNRVVSNGQDWDMAPDRETGYHLMQFTGRKDINGVEIYEGDINQDGGVCIWNADDASFCWDYPHVEMMPMGEEQDWAIIVGHIYAKP